MEKLTLIFGLMFGLDKNIAIDKTWALFLDRDGVINKRLIDDYVKSTEEFEFLPGAIEAIRELRSIFGWVFVVTNQQGIGKGLMTGSDLESVHQKMISELLSYNIQLDGIYHCPHLASDQCNCRKPEPGMALQARAEFPEIDFSKSLMIGDSISDIEFGKGLQMKTIFLDNGKRLKDLF